jgi:hypothetical protein
MKKICSHLAVHVSDFKKKIERITQKKRSILSCLFQPVHGSRVQKSSSGRPRDMPLNFLNFLIFQPVHGPCPEELIWKTTRNATYTANYQLSNDWHVPVEFNVPGGGVFFFVSQLTSFLL